MSNARKGLSYNEEDGTEIISGEDESHYLFARSDVQGKSKISCASKVDFVVGDGSTREIYKAVGSLVFMG